jgi:hypothetical protein
MQDRGSHGYLRSRTMECGGKLTSSAQAADGQNSYLPRPRHHSRADWPHPITPTRPLRGSHTTEGCPSRVRHVWPFEGVRRPWPTTQAWSFEGKTWPFEGRHQIGKDTESTACEVIPWSLAGLLQVQRRIVFPSSLSLQKATVTLKSHRGRLHVHGNGARYPRG